MAEPTSCCAVPGGYCARVDTLFNLPGVHVLDVAWHEWRRKLPAGLRLLVETSPAPTGCPGCGVIVEARGRRVRRLHDIPAFGAPVELVWRQRRYRCAEPDCPVRGFSEDHGLAPPRAKLATRAAWWAISQIAHHNASVQSAHGVGDDQAATEGVGGRSRPADRGGHGRGRRAHLASPAAAAERAEAADRDCGLTRRNGRPELGQISVHPGGSRRVLGGRRRAGGLRRPGCGCRC